MRDNLRVLLASEESLKNEPWGAWLTLSIKRPTSAHVMILQFVSSSPASGSVLTAQAGACFGFCLPLSLPLPSLCSVSLSLSLSLSLKNKTNNHNHKKKNKKQKHIKKFLKK